MADHSAELGHGHDHDYTKGGAHAHHILSQAKILQIAGALFALMVITIVAAFNVPEPLKNNTFFMQGLALLIAVVKASLVVYFYMGVNVGTRLVKIFAYGGFVWFFVLFVMLADYTTRPTELVPGWEPTPSSAMPRGSLKEPE
jgi:caa(3)-type oxidase subunit IV